MNFPGVEKWFHLIDFCEMKNILLGKSSQAIRVHFGDLDHFLIDPRSFGSCGAAAEETKGKNYK